MDWPQVEDWLATGCARLWEINYGQAFVLSVASEDEIEGVLCGGAGAREWVAHFERAMLALPEHEGMNFSISGRKGWRRYLPHWQQGGDEIRLATGG